jgi:activator of 2-hydroxyglutaryl-CoA dehydratase
MREIIGVCLGASSISFVKIKDENGLKNVEDVLTVLHNGDPKRIFKEKLTQFTGIDNRIIPIVVTGRKFRKLVKFTNISESEAVEYAFTHLNKNNEPFSAIASLGGETFMVYTIDDEGKISNVITGNQCASVPGNFSFSRSKE